VVAAPDIGGLTGLGDQQVAAVRAYVGQAMYFSIFIAREQQGFIHKAFEQVKWKTAAWLF
jgi:hypothetical protein